MSLHRAPPPRRRAARRLQVRLAVVDTLPAYAKALGMDVFNAKLKDVQARALADSVAHIRERAIANLGALATEFGDQWLREQILPAVLEGSKQSGPASYLGRMTSLQACGSLAGVMPASVVSETLVTQIAVPLSRDRVANVRIAAADALAQCARKLEKEDPAFIKDQIRPALVDLSKVCARPPLRRWTPGGRPPPPSSPY